MLAHLALLTVAMQADTVTLSPASYLELIATRGPGVVAATLRADAAEQRARQAGAWPNPELVVSVDNVGAQHEVTGRTGFEGLEGQAVLSFVVPVGGDRGARMQRDRGFAEEASALSRAVRLESVTDAVTAVASSESARRIAEGAAEERDALRALADALGAQAASGRAAEADAARARLEAVLMSGDWALARSTADSALADVARRAGFTDGEAVRISPMACVSPAHEEGGEPPRVAAAQARVTALRGAEALAGGERIPDLRPEIGIRRTMGVEALYAGLAVPLPLFDRGGRGLQGARAAADAAVAAATDETRKVAAETMAARTTFEALDAVGTEFAGPEWDADLQQVVEAARARLDAGEGTLAELLDARRARIRALEARAEWSAAWRIARARLSALLGLEPTPDLFCDPLIREDP